MTPSIAPLRNVAAFMALVDRVENRPFGLEGMAVFHGRSGEGKTTAVTVVANEFQAHCVQVKSCWNPGYLLKKMLVELGVKKPRGSNPALADMVAEQLMRTDRPLIIDDAQYLLKRQMIDIVRDIYESCKSTIILVGEEDLPLHLTKHENIHNRQLAWVQAVPCNMKDAQLLADIYAPGTEIDAELLAKILEKSGKAARRIAHNLADVQELARSKGLKRADLTLWGSREFHTGDLPTTTRPDVPTAPAAPVSNLHRKAS